ncbi:Crp/Fnr family transcriptional regulator [Niastella caeni]|uniref:Crp/Fnr family transcriptional regulator n=1 Tax=Niastella caeni TaxID=2569763 RepID=A0A4S8HZP7_9BACT|nr:Crp/Fnr family transcriptional regulator [Niastella caeni]THU41293.1 Crp/Fnr family transcriptional regulator [Niastella caeni]
MTSSTVNKKPGVEQWLSKTAIPESPFTLFVKNIYPVSKEAQEYLNQKSYPSQLDKGEFLVTAGSMCSQLYLIRKGILRSYVKEGAREITTWISSEQELVTCITSFGLQQPARENIQALEDCELSGLSFEDLQYLYDHFPEANIVGRKILEKYYRDAEERAFIARLMEATSKYKHFIATKSDLLNRVPLKFIASYLGMTLETLSRIRSKLSRNINEFN